MNLTCSVGRGCSATEASYPEMEQEYRMTEDKRPKKEKKGMFTSKKYSICLWLFLASSNISDKPENLDWVQPVQYTESKGA